MCYHAKIIILRTSTKFDLIDQEKKPQACNFTLKLLGMVAFVHVFCQFIKESKFIPIHLFT